MKHTPGPWKAVGNTVHSANERFNGKQVADCSTSVRGNANAHLIAAAPEMYDALRRLADAVDPPGVNDDLPLEDWARAPVEDARAILAKINGNVPEHA